MQIDVSYLNEFPAKFTDPVPPWFLGQSVLGKSFHIPLYHLGQIQSFQIGYIADGVTDPCSASYDPELDF